jgi:hypothetical protein
VPLRLRGKKIFAEQIIVFLSVKSSYKITRTQRIVPCGKRKKLGASKRKRDKENKIPAASQNQHAKHFLGAFVPSWQKKICGANHCLPFGRCEAFT